MAACDATESSRPPGVSPAPSGAGSPAAPAATSIPPVDGGTGTVTWNVPELVEQVQPQVVAVQTNNGEGSGVIFREDGMIVTNHHVIQDAAEVSVAFLSGETVTATVVASDARSDLAVLRVDRSGLTAATFADEVPGVGELAIAMGNPLGFEGSVSLGIVSGLNRAIPGSPILVDLIQTDAAISPGNSGGALIGADGRVIGINVAYIPPAASAVSIGFAIPSPTVIDVVDQLLETGRVSHAYLGVVMGTLTPPIRQQLDIGVERGAVILEVDPGSPADGTLEESDIVTSADGEPVDEVGDLLVELRQHEPGDTIALEIWRNGDASTVEITLGEAPEA